MSKRLFRFVPLLILAGCTNGTNPSDPSAPVTNDLIGNGPFGLHPVLAANPKSAGVTVPTILPPELIQTVAAQGSNVVENPATIDLGNGTSVTIGHYGYDDDGPLMPAPGDLPSATHIVEATKSEPDKNTYLELFGQTGADPTYDYGTHFLFQGHETAWAPAAAGRGHHPHQPGRRRPAPRDHHGLARPERRADLADRRLDLGSLRSAPDLHQRGRARPSTRRRWVSRRSWRTSPARSAAAATRACRTTRRATCGSSRTWAARRRPRPRTPRCRTASSTAS